MIEPKTGVFVGRLSATVRDRLWEHACKKMRGGAGTMIHSANTEQGYSVRFWGATSRWMVDLEGLTLVQKPQVL
jgi:CRISPR-associated protein Cas2